VADLGGGVRTNSPLSSLCKTGLRCDDFCVKSLVHECVDVCAFAATSGCISARVHVLAVDPFFARLLELNQIHVVVRVAGYYTVFQSSHSFTTEANETALLI